MHQQLLGDIDGRTTRMIALIVAAVMFLHGICCVIANLLLLRAAERERDEAVRLAIDASARQLGLERLAEYLLTGSAGGAAGVILSSWIAPQLAVLNPVRATSFAPLLTEFRLDGVMFAIGGVIALTAAIVVAVAPRVRSVTYRRLAVTLVSSARRAGSSRTHKMRLRLLVAAQIAIAVLLRWFGSEKLRGIAEGRSRFPARPDRKRG